MISKDNPPNQPKIFEDWEQVDCNECACYWDNSCDGVNTSEKGSTRLCKGFLATRSVVLPQKIKRLESTVKWLRIALMLNALATMLLAIGEILQ